MNASNAAGKCSERSERASWMGYVIASFSLLHPLVNYFIYLRSLCCCSCNSIVKRMLGVQQLNAFRSKQMKAVCGASGKQWMKMNGLSEWVIHCCLHFILSLSLTLFINNSKLFFSMKVKCWMRCSRAETKETWNAMLEKSSRVAGVNSFAGGVKRKQKWIKRTKQPWSEGPHGISII